MKKNQDPNWIKDIPLHISIEIGRTEKTINEILQWRRAATIKLEDSKINVLNIYVNDKYFGYGDVLRNKDGEMSLNIRKILSNEWESENDNV